MFFKNLLKANSTLHVSPLFYLTVRPCRSHKKSKRFLGISGHFFFIVNIFIKHFFFYLYSIQVHPKNGLSVWVWQKNQAKLFLLNNFS